jgi:poly-gamma-glutamate synthesis protein (capsule biosynthesis protein)
MITSSRTPLYIKREKKRKRIIISSIIAALVLISLVVWFFISGKYSNQPDADIVPPEPQITGYHSRLLLMGTTFWGRYINDWSMASELGTVYPFQSLSEFDRDGYDAWIAGLECPTVADLNLSSAAQEVALSFNCPPEYLPEAAKWFTAFTLANNHTDNQGADGFAETKQRLSANGIQHFGHYDPEALNEVCGLVQIPFHIEYDNGDLKSAKIPLVFCGYHGIFKIPSAESLALISKYAEFFPVIAMPHMGAEYQPAADSLKTAVYRAMIDNGAEMVVGDHPHWVQNSEVYGGKLILYSLGNFMFDQQFDSEVTRSALLDITMRGSSGIEQWLDLSEQCGGDLEKCYELVKNSNLPKLKLGYEFMITGSSSSGKITHRASLAELESIKQRLNWARTVQSLLE